MDAECPGEEDYLVTTTFRVRAQSSEQAVNETRDYLRSVNLGRLADSCLVLDALRIRRLDTETTLSGDAASTGPVDTSSTTQRRSTP